MIRDIVSKFSQWLSKKQRAALTTEAQRPGFLNHGVNRGMRRARRAQWLAQRRRRGRGVSGDKLARKAQQHKLCGRYSRLARRLEIIELRKREGLDVKGTLTCRFPGVRAA